MGDVYRILYHLSTLGLNLIGIYSEQCSTPAPGMADVILS